jgi:hypothetical protein
VGFVPIDVTVARAADGSPRYTAVWAHPDEARTEVRLVAGPVGEDEQRAQTALVEEKFNCQVATAVFDAEGRPHGCSLWTRREGQTRSTTRVYHGPADEFREDDCPGLLLTDAQLSEWVGQVEGAAASLPLTTALWNVSIRYESKALYGLTPEQHLAEARRLAAAGYRPASISASVDGPGPGEAKG